MATMVDSFEYCTRPFRSSAPSRHCTLKRPATGNKSVSCSRSTFISASSLRARIAFHVIRGSGEGNRQPVGRSVKLHVRLIGKLHAHMDLGWILVVFLGP